MDAEAFVRAATEVATVPLVPELRLHVAPTLVPLWEAVEQRVGGSAPPPFWAFPWPGSVALARYVLDHSQLVVGRRVLDFAAGSGLAGVAAARSGAASVAAADIDPLAAAAQRLNAQLNGVTLEVCTADLVGSQQLGADVLLVGDVCYERTLAERIVPWLRQVANQGALVLLADPGRAYTPTSGLAQVATYEVPTTLELERAESMRTSVWQLLPSPS